MLGCDEVTRLVILDLVLVLGLLLRLLFLLPLPPLRGVQRERLSRLRLDYELSLLELQVVGL